LACEVKSAVSFGEGAESPCVSLSRPAQHPLFVGHSNDDVALAHKKYTPQYIPGGAHGHIIPSTMTLLSHLTSSASVQQQHYIWSSGEASEKATACLLFLDGALVVFELWGVMHRTYRPITFTVLARMATEPISYVT
jgi:hypothetical protein